MRSRTLYLGLLLTWGCQSNTPDATGVMERPVGLAVVPRTANREDLFIADSEAQGVRLQQFSLDSEGALRSAFALGPAVYFPLVIPARGLPTELAYVEGQDRLFVLSPSWKDATGEVGGLHVQAVVGATSIESHATEPSNELLGTVPLSALGIDGVPVDVEVLTPGSAVDEVAVLFDVLGGEGVLALLEVTHDPVSATLVDQVVVGPAPRQMAQTSPGVLMVALADEAASPGNLAVVSTASGALDVRQVDVGGPISRVVPVKDGRALALRLDRASVMVVEADGTVSTRDYPSPYTPLEERGQVPGRIDMPLMVVAGAQGAVTTFPGLTITTGETLPVVQLVLLDGTARFLVGDDLVPQREAEAYLSAMLRNSGEADPSYIRECAAESVLWCVGAEGTDPACPGLIQVERPSAAVYRAVYRGDLVRSRSAEVTVLDDTGKVALAVPEVTDMLERLVVPGDEALIQLFLPACADRPDASVELYAHATVEEAFRERLVLQLVDFAEGTAVLDDVACHVDAVLAATLVEVYPAGAEAVLQQVSNETITGIQARVPVVDGPSGQQAARIDTRADGLPTDLGLTLASASGFSCLEGTEGRRCASNTDCGSGRGCASTSDITGISCPGVCASTCTSDTTCLPDEIVRQCSGVELAVTPTTLVRANLGDNELRGVAATVTEVVNSVPYDTVWLPIAGGWVTSFPGSRDLLLLRSRSTGFIVNVFR
ncbi:MAG: hypothetical protein KC933_17150 [Myxococcales bacterium]|nr:hypothetical protein [Myxococcales bacterium]